MSKTYRAHPLMILSRMKPFLLVLILPFVRILLQYITDRAITNILGIELTIFGIILFFSVLSWRSFRLTVMDDSISLRSGIIFVKRATIKISSLSSVQSEQNIIDRLFRSVTYSINTEAGRRNKSDFRFKLYKKDSREVSLRLYGNKGHNEVKFSVLRVAVLAATTSSAFTGMIIGVPVINKAGDLLGLAIYDMLFDEINNVSRRFTAIFPPIVNAVTLILLLGYAISFVYSFLKYINFKLFLGDENLEIRSGFFTRTRTSFKKDSVNDIKIEQTPIMTLFKSFAVKVSVGGYGDSKSESAVIMPSGTQREIVRSFSAYFPFITPKGKRIHAPNTVFTKSRFLFLPGLYFILISLSSLILALLFKDFGRLILFSTAVFLAIDLYYGFLSLRESRFGKVHFGESIFAHSTKGLRITELYCPKERIGEIKIRRFLTDFPQNTCRVKITVRSEGADSIRIRMLPYDDVREEIKNSFGIEV